MAVAIKEKVIFGVLLVVLIVLGIFSVAKFTKPREALLLPEEAVPEEGIRLLESERVELDIAGLATIRPASDYLPIKDRSPFFKFTPKPVAEPGVGIPVPPKREIFVYKGRAVIGGEQKVVIEEVESGEVYFVGEGDMVGDYKLIEIGEKEVTLSAPDGKKIRLKL